MRHSRGFTLIEVVVSMVVGTIVVGFMAMFLSTPVDAYVAQTRRAELTDAAEAAMRRISDDVRVALPNSVRWQTIGTLRILEMVEISAIGTYREAGTWPEGDTLLFGVPDGSFDVVGVPVVSGAVSNIVVDNRRNAARSVYGGVNVITPAASAITPTATGFTIAPPFPFTNYADRSLNRRAYAVSGVTRYECNLTTRTLSRYQGLPITAAVVAAPAGPGTLIANDVTACTFNATAGTHEHGGVALVDITVSRTTNGNPDRLRLLRQVQVENPS